LLIEPMVFFLLSSVTDWYTQVLLLNPPANQACPLFYQELYTSAISLARGPYLFVSVLFWSSLYPFFPCSDDAIFPLHTLLVQCNIFTYSDWVDLFFPTCVHICDALLASYLYTLLLYC
jgi:hypothetical protein